MRPIDRLIDADRSRKLRIAVIGDPLTDVWVHGELLPSQDGVQKFVEQRTVQTAGGAAGASRQLQNWNAEAILLAPPGPWPLKARYIDPQGRIVFRHDRELNYDPVEAANARQSALRAIRDECFDAVLISDYDKGFLTEQMIREIIDWCKEKVIPIVADAKRPPDAYKGAILKANDAWHERHEESLHRHSGHGVITRGRCSPIIHHFTYANTLTTAANETHALLVNHVGAGDAFAAHLTLGLAHELNLEDAADIAHSAGRCYVQHLHGRPTFPHEVRKDLDPIGGKILRGPLDVEALRKSINGNLVFSNGVFRLGPHAGSSCTLEWAKNQGDVLVVGMNDRDSARWLRPGEFVMDEDERARALASLAFVDWVISFGELDPCALIRQLKPEILVKGPDYAGSEVPGADLVREVRFAPATAFTRHARDLVEVMRASG